MPGLIERYRDRLPFAEGDPVVSLQEGSTPLVHAPRGQRAGRRGGVAEARGRQPDRLVQGPRHDVRGAATPCATGAEAVICASTGNTAASLAAYAARAGHRRRGDRPRGQDRRGQARPGADARRARRRAARQLRRGARARARADPAPPDRAGQLASTRSASRARRRRRSRSSRSSARSTRCASRSATPGNITAYWKGFQEAGARAADARLPGRGRRAAGARRAGRAKPETVASAIRIGNPARWEEAMAAVTESRGAHRGRHRRRDPRRLPPARRARGRLLRAGERRVGRRPAQARRRRRARASSASSPATG